MFAPRNERIQSFPFKENSEETIRLRRNSDVLQRVWIKLTGKINLSASGTGMRRGGIANLIDSLKMDISGYHSGLGRRLRNYTVMDLPGWCFGFVPSAVGSGQMNKPRYNFLTPFTPVMAAGSQITDIDPTDLTSQDFSFTVELPFYSAQGRNAGDFNLDLAGIEFLDVQFKMGRISDMFTNAAGAGEIDATVEVYLETLRDMDPFTANGNNVYPQAMLRTYLEEFSVDADAQNLQRPIRMAQSNIYAMSFLAFNVDANGKETTSNDTVIERVRILRDQNSITDFYSDQLRYKNIEQFPQFARGVPQADGHWFKNSGMYIFAPTIANGNDRSLLSRSVFTGAGDDSAIYELQLKKPAANDAKIIIVKQAIEMSPALQAISRSNADLLATPAAHALAAGAMQARAARQIQVANAALSS